ncbi:dTMP kinase, partial [Candidatus Micrarchaeota archaeon CG06_land_8_20_14_3_00_50_6]
MLIVFEGIDGSGKETQVGMCRDYLKGKAGAAEVVLHKYPTGNFRELHKYLEGASELDAKSQFLLFLADIANEQKDIRSEFMQGKIVILDRYVFSTIAYQGEHLGTKTCTDLISKLDFIKPDLAVLLDLPARKAMERKQKQKSLDRFESDAVFLESVRSRYLKLAMKRFGSSRWAVLNADRDENVVHSDVVDKISSLFPDPIPKTENSKPETDFMDPIEFHKKLRGKLSMLAKAKCSDNETLALAYTPGVAKVSEAIARDRKLAYDYTGKWNTIAIITDGTRVLGLGDIGPEAALPVMEGKSVLFKEFGNVNALPICVATKKKEEIEFIARSLVPILGGINLEDIESPKCFELYDELSASLAIPVFHDDQDGTAIVIVAALFNGLGLVEKKFDETKIVILGAGAAGSATSKLINSTSPNANIILCDSDGVLSKARKELEPHKKKLLEFTNKKNISDYSSALDGADIFIGLSGKGKLTIAQVKSMAEDPIILALSNPEPEIKPSELDSVKCIVGTGRSDFHNQVNNVLAFPGIFRGVLSARAPKITQNMKANAAKAIANSIEPTRSKILPFAFEKEVHRKVAIDVALTAIADLNLDIDEDDVPAIID